MTVKVQGQGVFDPGTTTEREVVPVGGRPVTTTLESDGNTNDGTADLRLSIAFGDTVQSKYNVIYVIDVSGSTGVDGSFGDTTVLDAQISALKDLTAEFMRPRPARWRGDDHRPALQQPGAADRAHRGRDLSARSSSVMTRR